MNIDQNVLNFFAANRTEWLTFAALAITYSGSYMVASAVAFMSALSFYLHKHFRRIVPLIISVAGSAATTFFLKIVVNRPRPLAFMLYADSDPSFPSGHATAAMALYGFLFYVIWQYDSHRLKKPFLFFLSLLIILVGASRLYLGMHYLSDVLGGYAVGLIWIFIGTALDKKIERLFNWKPKIGQ